MLILSPHVETHLLKIKKIQTWNNLSAFIIKCVSNFV